MADLELKLTGCLGQSGSGGFVLEKAHMSETDAEATSGRDAAVTQDVALQGASAELRPHVGHLVEVHGNFEQGAVNDEGQPILNVAEVEMVADNCDRPAR
jgi:hypothetical protein